MAPLPPGRRGGPAFALFSARLIYAFNWYNIGAVLPLVGTSLGVGTARLGIVLGAFLVGVGIFQVPAGFAAIRYGSRRVSLSGLTVMSLACIGSAFSPTFEWLAGARFVAGVGAAFFFSPALSLIASYYPAGQRGPVIGLYNGGFSVGGAIGLFGGAFLGEAYGWAVALGVGGVALLLASGVAAWVLPPETVGSKGTVRELWRSGRPVVASRSIWALSVGLTGFWGAVYVVAQYFVKFVHDVHPSWGVGTAAGLAAGVVIVSFPGGPIGGWLAEQGADRRLLIGLFGLGASLSVLAIPFCPLWALWPVLLALGLLDGIIFAILYLIPTYLPETQDRGLALGVAMVNSIQVLLGSSLAVGFGFLAAAYGYTDAWLFAGVTSLALLPLLMLVVAGRGARDGFGVGPTPAAAGPR